MAAFAIALTLVALSNCANFGFDFALFTAVWAAALTITLGRIFLTVLATLLGLLKLLQ